jgi:hypothetical protein
MEQASRDSRPAVVVGGVASTLLDELQSLPAGKQVFSRGKGTMGPLLMVQDRSAFIENVKVQVLEEEEAAFVAANAPKQKRVSFAI